MSKLEFKYYEKLECVLGGVKLVVYSSKFRVLYVINNKWFACKSIEKLGKNAELISIYFMLGELLDYLDKGDKFEEEVELVYLGSAD